MNLSLRESLQESSAYCCNSTQAILLSVMPTEYDIMIMMFKINPNKSHGLDGLTSRLYSCSGVFWERMFNMPWILPIFTHDLQIYFTVIYMHFGVF